MKWIDQQEVEDCISTDLKNELTTATNDIIKIKDAAKRKEYIDKNRNLWKKFKDELSDDLKEVCWYCESEIIRSDMSIDHFRPKNAVKECKAHAGYWWLAFDWKNYRYACQYCNEKRVFDGSSGGKSSHFPLMNKSKRIYKPQSIEPETPAFLDPCNLYGLQAIWFDDNGKFTIHPKDEEDDNLEEMIKNTSEIYHLNELRITRKRKTISTNINRKVRALRDAIDNKDMGKKNEIENDITRIAKEKEHNSTRIIYLKSFKNVESISELLKSLEQPNREIVDETAKSIKTDLDLK